MPLYCYKCPECNETTEEYHMVKDRYNQRCKKCGVEMNIEIQPIVSHIFHSFWHPNLTKKPVYVESKKHLKDLDKKYNTTSYY